MYAVWRADFPTQRAMLVVYDVIVDKIFEWIITFVILNYNGSDPDLDSC